MAGLVDPARLRLQEQECQVCGALVYPLWMNVGPAKVSCCYECMKGMG